MIKSGTPVGSRTLNIRPHRSLGRLTPLEFAAQETDPKTCGIHLQGMGSNLLTPSLHPKPRHPLKSTPESHHHPAQRKKLRNQILLYAEVPIRGEQ